MELKSYEEQLQELEIKFKDFINYINNEFTDKFNDIDDIFIDLDHIYSKISKPLNKGIQKDTFEYLFNRYDILKKAYYPIHERVRKLYKVIEWYSDLDLSGESDRCTKKQNELKVENIDRIIEKYFKKTQACMIIEDYEKAEYFENILKDLFFAKTGLNIRYDDPSEYLVMIKKLEEKFGPMDEDSKNEEDEEFLQLERELDEALRRAIQEREKEEKEDDDDDEKD